MANTLGTESTRRCTSRLYTANISASRVEKCRYKVTGPTPARLATSLSDVVPDSANASCATCRIWSRFRCASERRTWTRVRSAMVFPSCSTGELSGTVGLRSGELSGISRLGVAMQYIKLGTTGLDVSPVAIGAMTYGDPGRGHPVWSLGEDESRPLIKHARGSGINFFDTA